MAKKTANKKANKKNGKRKPNAVHRRHPPASASTKPEALAAEPITQTRPATPGILPPPLDEAAQRAAGARMQAAIIEAASAPLDDGLRRDTLVDAPKVLLEEEHRTLPRVTLAVDVDLSSDSHFFTGLSGDISEGGLFVSTYRNVDVGSEVALEFSLPNGAVQTRGLVRWHRDASPYGPPGIGIEFDALSDEERRIIHDFCAARAPLYYEVDQL